MYIDGTSAVQMLEPVFEVLEGGGEVPASNVVEFVADNGTKIADVTMHEVNAANGAAAEIGEVVDISTGATAGTATGAGILTMEVGAVGAAIAPALGILAGVGLYNLAPEFWTNLSNALVNAGKTVGGKVVGFISKDGTTSFDEETIEIVKNFLLNSGILDATSEPTLPANPVGTLYDIPIISSVSAVSMIAQICPNVPNDIIADAVARVTNITPDLANNCGVLGCYEHINELGQGVFMITPVYSGVGWEYTDAEHTKVRFTSDPGENGGYIAYRTDGAGAYYVKLTETGPWSYISTGTAINPYLYGGAISGPGVSGTGTTNLLFAISMTPSTNVQEGAVLPTDDPFPLTYPTWTPYEFPETLPAYMPDVYPCALPTPTITQDPAQEGANETAPQQDALVNQLYDNAPSTNPDVNPDTDPYSPPASDPTPPQPTPDPDPIDPNPSPTPSGATIPLPTLDTTRASKMFTVYNPTDAQVDALGGFLWTNSIIEQIKKMWQNPLDGIISFHKVYCSPTTGSSKNIVLGYIDSGVSALEVTSQFADVDCGTVHIPERLHNATDYSPFTALHCYLPFIGMVELDTDECMNADLHIKYRIDVYTGTCVALLYLKRDVDMPNEQIVYTFSGNASQKLPLTAADFSGAVGALLGLAGAGVAVASGGSLGVAAGALGAAHSLTSEMVHIQHSGGLSANAGILSPRVPYIILSRQYGYDANAYNSFYGYPANKTVYIGNCNGFIKCKEVLFVGSCTEEEIAEIHAILKEGVYV